MCLQRVPRRCQLGPPGFTKIPSIRCAAEPCQLLRAICFLPISPVFHRLRKMAGACQQRAKMVPTRAPPVPAPIQAVSHLHLKVQSCAEPGSQKFGGVKFLSRSDPKVKTSFPEFSGTVPVWKLPFLNFSNLFPENQTSILKIFQPSSNPTSSQIWQKLNFLKR